MPTNLARTGADIYGLARFDFPSMKDWLHHTWDTAIHGPRDSFGAYGEWYQLCATLDMELAPLE